MVDGQLRSTFLDQGYVVIPSAFTGPELIVLRAAAARTIALTRSGKWPYARTIPKEFPPWPSDPSDISSRGIWGVQHLLHPALPENGVFALSYFGDAVINPVKQLLDCEENDLVAGRYDLLCRPDEDFSTRWHLDGTPLDVTTKQEKEKLSQPVRYVEWNVALHEDHSLVLVPKSQCRARTEAERNADPLGAMPGGQVINLQPGDLVFYDSNA